MPILDIHIVISESEILPDDLAATLATALGNLLGAGPGLAAFASSRGQALRRKCDTNQPGSTPRLRHGSSRHAASYRRTGLASRVHRPRGCALRWACA